MIRPPVLELSPLLERIFSQKGDKRKTNTCYPLTLACRVRQVENRWCQDGERKQDKKRRRGDSDNGGDMMMMTQREEATMETETEQRVLSGRWLRRRAGFLGGYRSE